MQRTSLLVLALVASCASGARETPKAPPTAAGIPPLPRIAAKALSSHEAHRLAASLADEVGPRLAGSPGDPAGVKWAENAMRTLSLANVHTEPVVVPVWQRGPERAEIVTPRTSPGRNLDVNALGWSGSTPPEGVDAEIVRVATVDELAKLPDEAVRGKIPFVDAPMAKTPDGSGYGRAVGNRYRAQTVAGAKGALAVLIRSVGTDEQHPHTGSTNRGETAGIPIGALSNGSADLLAREVAAGPTRLRLVLTSKRLPDAPSANVVGEIVGSAKPEEVVLLAAHLDSWDTGRGALDDGAGCGVVLDAMRVLATEKPGRTVRVVLFAAEENSRAGGTAYAKAHADEAERIVLSLEVDGGTDVVQTLGFVGDPGKAPAIQAIARPLSPLAVRFTEGKAHPGADVTPLLLLGVPTIDVRQNVSRYFDLHHTRGDTTDQLDANALAQVTAVVAHVALRAADPSLSFGRVPPALRKDD